MIYDVPLPATKYLLVLNDDFVRGDADVEHIELTPSEPLLLAFLPSAEVGDDLERGTPLLYFHLPIDQYAGRHHDQMRTPNSLDLRQIAKQSDRLNSLAQAHLISQNAIQILLLKLYQPLHSRLLIHIYIYLIYIIHLNI